MLDFNNKRKWYEQPEDPEYPGNIWGWKFSIFGLVLILIFGGLMVYRHVSMGIPFGEFEPKEEVTLPQDSLETTTQE